MFEFKDGYSYSMPPFFGGARYDPKLVVNVGHVVQMNFVQTTDANRLSEYLPKGFTLLRPELNISFIMGKEVDFMAGGAYNMMQVHIPVQFKGTKDRESGEFMLVVWENKTHPIIGGREENGVPKVFADMQDIRMFDGKYFTNLSYDGNTFLNLEMENPQPLDAESLSKMKDQSENMLTFGWRYIPRVGAAGADISQPVTYPASMIIRDAWTGTGSVKWTPITYAKHPGQFHIINSLAGLPVYKTGPVTMLIGSLTMKPRHGRVLE